MHPSFLKYSFAYGDVVDETHEGASCKDCPCTGGIQERKTSWESSNVPGCELSSRQGGKRGEDTKKGFACHIQKWRNWSGLGIFSRLC